MKHFIIATIALLATSTTNFAGSGPDKSIIENPSAITNAFKKVVVNDDVDVVLTESKENRIIIKGESKDVMEVSYFIKKGVLYIGSKNESLKNKVVVHLSVNQIQGIEVNGQSEIISNGYLNSSKLKVTVNAAAKFDLKNIGKIYFQSNEEIDLHFEKWRGFQRPSDMLSATKNSGSGNEVDARFLINAMAK